MSWLTPKTPTPTDRAAAPAGTAKGAAPLNMPPRKTWLIFVVLLLANYLLMRLLVPGPDDPLTVPYTVFKEQVASGNVESIYSRGASIEGRFAAAGHVAAGRAPTARRPAARPAGPTAAAATATTFTTTLPAFVDPGLEAFLIEHRVEISAVPIHEGSAVVDAALRLRPGDPASSRSTSGCSGARQQGGGMGGGSWASARARRAATTRRPDERVTFDDVAGIDEAENELVEIVDFLKAPEKYTRLGGTAPKGVLLVGAPGTGKTLLAKAVAGEAGVPFFSMSAAEFVEMIVGVGAARVRDLFKQAREHAPAIIFIDEIDSIGRARGQVGDRRRRASRSRRCNQILTEMDGFSGREGIIVLAATNQPDVLDRALLRPGPLRSPRRREPARTRPAARRSCKVHTRKVPLAQRRRTSAELAAATPGFSGADLKNLVNEAALLAARREQDEVRQKDFLDALEKIVLGPERPLLLTPRGPRAHRLSRERPRDPRPRRAGRRPGASRDDRAARPGARRHLPAAADRPLQLSRGVSARAHRRHARRARGRGGRVRHADDRRRERHRAGDAARAQHGHALGHERRARHGAARAARESVPRRRRGYGGDKPVQRGDRAPRSTPRCSGSSTRATSEAKRLLDAAPQARSTRWSQALLARETLGEQEILEVTGLPPAPALENRPLAAVRAAQKT